LCERLDGCGVVEDEDEICELETYLATKTPTDGAYGGGSRPAAIGQAGDDQTGAEPS
jgi:hypothetical protein